MGYKWATCIMKHFSIIAIIAMMFAIVAMPAEAQSLKDKKKAKKEKWEKDQQRAKEEEELKWQLHMDSLRNAAAASVGNEVQIPCVESSYDDEEYFRDLGIGTDKNNNKQAARLNAVNQAKSMVKARLAEFVQGVTTEYFNTYNTAGATDDVQHKMETKLNGVVEFMLNNADKECERLIWNNQGNYEVYYVIRIPKGELKSKMMNALNEEKLKIDFNENRMQQFMDSRMDKMLQDKSKAGY